MSAPGWSYEEFVAKGKPETTSAPAKQFKKSFAARGKQEEKELNYSLTKQELYLKAKAHLSLLAQKLNTLIGANENEDAIESILVECVNEGMKERKGADVVLKKEFLENSAAYARLLKELCVEESKKRERQLKQPMIQLQPVNVSKAPFNTLVGDLDIITQESVTEKLKSQVTPELLRLLEEESVKKQTPVNYEEFMRIITTFKKYVLFLGADAAKSTDVISEYLRIIMTHLEKFLQAKVQLNKPQRVAVYQELDRILAFVVFKKSSLQINGEMDIQNPENSTHSSKLFYRLNKIFSLFIQFLITYPLPKSAKPSTSQKKRKDNAFILTVEETITLATKIFENTAAPLTSHFMAILSHLHRNKVVELQSQTASSKKATTKMEVDSDSDDSDDSDDEEDITTVMAASDPRVKQYGRQLYIQLFEQVVKLAQKQAEFHLNVDYLRYTYLSEEYSKHQQGNVMISPFQVPLDLLLKESVATQTKKVEELEVKLRNNRTLLLSLLEKYEAQIEENLRS